MQNKNKISEFIKSFNHNDNLIYFDFKNYKKSLDIEYLLNKSKFSCNESPLLLFKKIIKRIEKENLSIEIEYQSFLNHFKRKYKEEYFRCLDFYINKFLQKNFGPNKIKDELVKKGFELEEIEIALSKYSNEFWEEKIQKLANKFSHLIKNPQKLIKKLLNYGFTHEQIQSFFPNYEY